MSVPDPLAIDESDCPTAVYRLFDASQRLLYVGMTRNLRSRLADHAAKKPWWDEVASQTTIWYGSREAAKAAEDDAIKNEDPLYNIHSTPKHRERTEAGLRRRAERLAREGERVGTYDVRAQRTSKYWELHIDEAGVTQSRNLADDADAMIRSFVHMTRGDAPDSITYNIVPELGDALDAEVAEARAASLRAKELVEVAAARNRAAARHLRAAGLSGRDTAAVLGVTPQRVSQLLGSRS